MDVTSIIDRMLDDSECEEHDTTEASVNAELSGLLEERGIRLTPAELDEARFVVTKRRILRGAEKLKARLYRLANRSRAKLNKRKYLRTAGAKRLKRLWAKFKNKNNGLLKSMRKRFGKRSMVRLVANDDTDHGTVFGESTVKSLDETTTKALIAGYMTSEAIGIMGQRFAEADQLQHAAELADAGERMLAATEALEAGGSLDAFDAVLESVSVINANAYEQYQGDEFWDTYSEQSEIGRALAEAA